MSKAASSAASSSSSSASAAAGPGEAALLAAIKAAQDKPALSRKDGLAALATALAGGAWSNALTSASAAKVLGPLLREGQSFINHFAAINEDNLTAFLPFYSALLRHHGAFLAKQGLLDAPQSPLWITLVKLSVHASFKIRTPVLRVLAEALASTSGTPQGEQLQSVLLRALQIVLNAKNAASFSAPAAPYIWSRTLLTIAAQPVPALMPLALLLAHDPLLNNADAKSWRSVNTTFDALLTAWSSRVASLGDAAGAVLSAAVQKQRKNIPAKDREALRATVVAQMPSISALLFSNQALLPAQGTIAPPLPAAASSSAVPAGANAAAAAAVAAAAAASASAGMIAEVDEVARSERQRLAAVGLLLSLFRMFPALSLEMLYQPLLALLSHPDFAALSESDVAVFKTAEGTLCDFLGAGEFRAVVAESKNVKRPAGWTEKDEELERRAAAKAAEQAAAKKPAGGAGAGAGAKGAAGGKPGAKAVPLTGAAKVEAELKKKLEDQSVLRAKLLAAKRQVEPVLRFFSQLSIRQPSFVHSVLPSLLPRVYALFSNEIVRPTALQTHRDLLRCLDLNVQTIGSRVSLSVEAVQQFGAAAFADPNHKRLMSRTLVQLRAAARKKSFSPHTFLYIFPLLQATLAHSADIAVDLSAKNEPVEDEDEEEHKVHAGGAKKVSTFQSKDADDEEGEEEEDEAEEDEGGDDNEEKKNDGEESKEDAEAAEGATGSSSTAAAASPSERDDSEKALAPGLQLSVLSASEVLNLHCTPDLHPAAPAAPAVWAPYPVARMYSSLLHAIGHINAVYKPSLDALVLLSSGQGITSEQVLPLLSTEGVLNKLESVRLSSLQGCEVLHCFSVSQENRLARVPHMQLFTQRMWIACHDSKSDVAARAASIWETFGLQIDAEYIAGLIELLTSPEVVIRTAVGSAIASTIQREPAVAFATLQRMIALFEASPDEVISSNSLGLRAASEFVSRSHTRSGVAQAIGACTDSINSPEILQLSFGFFVRRGLKDMNDRVWEDILNATLRLINQHGKQFMAQILPILEDILKRDFEHNAARAAAIAAAAAAQGKKKGAANAPAPAASAGYVPLSDEEEAQNDRLREGVILSMGTLARHMDEGNPALVGVVDSLIESLQTPSHSVQKSVSECLAPLMSFVCVSEQAGKWIDLLLLRLHTADEFGERMGAAFGLAGMIKGLKLAALKKYNILDQLAVMVQDKTSARARQGALFAYERLFFELGSRFEPYAATILPHLLACYGDPNLEVREATQDAAKMIMSHLTSFGIKIVLPLVLKALDEKQWRTKLESIGLLSAMAYCSPTQLSACLPMIVPRLLEVMTDPNAKVQTASRAALRQIGSVIKNPEILTLVPVLLAALNDPTTHTKRALQDLMRTSFVHSVDPPSLALIIPILKKGLKGRTAVTKKMSAQVVGSMCSLIGDVKDILPYAGVLLKYLKGVLVDPSPEVRAVAARALASLYKGIVDQEVEGFVELREYLLETLRSDATTPTIRSGCAQGLAQLLAVQGLEPTSQLLPSLFAETKSERAVVREGFFNLLGFMPEAFQSIFSIFVADVLPVIVAGLADEIGLVREAALAAGQALVINFAQTKTELLLPALEDGIINSDWRIRLSSVQLLGVMLLRLAGVSVRMIVGANAHDGGDDEDKNAATICTREQENHIESVLGTDRRNRLISTVYLMRCDVVPAVADLAFRVWKSIVSNSPRMLTTILPVLMSLIISDLASTKEERQAAAGRTLGELVQKMGDYILSEIVPILQARLASDDKFTRQGVCLGLSEVMGSSRKNDLAAFMALLIPSVRDALCDNEELVRKAAGTCFLTLLRAVGRRAIDDIVPALLWRLDEEEGDAFRTNLVLEGMRVVLSINSSDVLPYLVPALIKSPLTLFHAKALAFLSANFTKGFIRYCDAVTVALIDGISRAKPEELAEMRVACAQVVLCVSQDCVHSFCNVLEETSTSSKDPAVRSAVAHLISSFTSNTKTNFESHIPLLLQILLRLFIEEGDLLQAAWDALDAMLKSVPEEAAAKHITFVRSVLSDIGFDQYSLKRRSEIPGFCLKKGVAPLLPMFQFGLMQGTPPVRCEAADGLSDIISYTSEAALAPFVIKITGPLIRIVGDRFSAEVKSAILNTLYLLICKCPKHLKAFLPQLQTSFLKALSDPAAIVRDRAGLALAELITEPKRAVTVLTELAALVSSDAAAPLKTSALQAMVGVVSNKAIAGNLPPEVVMKNVLLADSQLGHEKEQMRRQCARLMAINAVHLSEAELGELVNVRLMRKPVGKYQEKDGVLSALQAIVRMCGDKIESSRAAITKFSIAYLSDSHDAVISAALLTLGDLLVFAAKRGDQDSVVQLSAVLVPFLQSEVAQIRLDAVSRFQLLGQSTEELSAALYDTVVPGLVSRTQDPNGLVRTAVVGACHTLFQFHVPDGFDRAEKLLGTYHARAMKKDASAATALVLFVKKSVARAKVGPVVDELFASTAQGETIVDSSASSSSAAAGDDEDEDE